MTYHGAIAVLDRLHSKKKGYIWREEKDSYKIGRHNTEVKVFVEELKEILEVENGLHD